MEPYCPLEGIVVSDCVLGRVAVLLASLPPLRVLLVEADQAVGSTLERALRRQGWPVTWARTGAESLRLKEAFQPEVVLLALDLPDIGNAALISGLTQRRDCAVVALSGSGGDAEADLVARGVHDYIAKPVTLRILVARIQAVQQEFALECAAAC